MGQFVDKGFVLGNTLVFNPIGSGLITLLGAVTCVGGIGVDVYKILQIVDGAGSISLVQTTEYSDHARLVGIGNILR